MLDSFLEGPSFDRAGNLYLCDIPWGRIFRVSPQLDWTLVAEYDGWPNGLALHADGSLWIADYRRGLLRLSAGQLASGVGAPEVVLAHRRSESFKGLNDLTFDAAGNCYFTDQGQTGLHDPSGRVYRLGIDGRLTLLLGNVPSPNGLALSADGSVLFIAATRANAVWRAPLFDGGCATSKVGEFQHFFGSSGPDGLACDDEGRLVVAHASLGSAFVLDALGAGHACRAGRGGTGGDQRGFPARQPAARADRIDHRQRADRATAGSGTTALFACAAAGARLTPQPGDCYIKSS